MLSLSQTLSSFSLAPRSASGSSRKAGTKKTHMLAVLFAQAALAFGFLSYPMFLQFGAHNGLQDKTPTREQFNFCQLLRGEPAQSCGVTTRFVLREIQSEMGDPRACLQVSSTSSVLLYPWHIANWDRTSLIAYSTYYWRSDLLSKRLKARSAQYMLDKHREIDTQCQSGVIHSAG
jgi:hypothetical protein